MSHIALLENPYYNPRRRSHRRNPKGVTASVRQWSQGVTVTDAVAAASGLAAASIIPGMIVKSSAGTTVLTTTQKLLKLVVSAATAMAAGYIGKTVNPGVGKAAIIGGFAGTAAMALSSFTSYKVLGTSMALPMGRFANAIPVSPTPSREGETVSLIQP